MTWDNPETWYAASDSLLPNSVLNSKQLVVFLLNVIVIIHFICIDQYMNVFFARKVSMGLDNFRDDDLSSLADSLLQQKLDSPTKSPQPSGNMMVLILSSDFSTEIQISVLLKM